MNRPEFVRFVEQNIDLRNHVAVEILEHAGYFDEPEYPDFNFDAVRLELLEV